MGTAGKPPEYPDPHVLFGTSARLLAYRGHAAALSVLANGNPKIEFSYSDRDFGVETYYYALHIELEPRVYANLKNAQDIELTIHQTLNEVEKESDRAFNSVSITSKKVNDPKWQEQSRRWLAGENVSNQGRVRSDNIAGLECDGLLFRSQPEIFLYQALKAKGVSFAPLPVFVRGGRSYQRMEPDFVVLKDGICLIIEVDGDTYHRETPAEAHARTTILLHEGAKLERYQSTDCDTAEKAAQLAQRILDVIEKLKRSE